MSRNRSRPNEAGRVLAYVWALVGAYFLWRWWGRGETWHGAVAACTLAAAPLLWFLAGPEQDPEGRSGIAWPLISLSTLAWIAAVAFDLWSLASRP